VKSKTILLVGAAGVIAYLLWQKSKAAPQAGATAQMQPATEEATTVTAQPTVPLISSPSSPSDQQIVSAFMDQNLNPCNKQRFDQLLPSMSTDEITGLSQIITDYWQAGNGNLPSDLRTLWDSWRVKYKINDNTICPFP
jgi:hypothetical protein